MKLPSVLLPVTAFLLAVAPVKAALTFVHSGTVVPLPEAIRIVDVHGGQSPIMTLTAPSITTNLMTDTDSQTVRFSGTVGTSTTTLSYTTPTTLQHVGYTTPPSPNPPEPIYASGFATIDITLSFAGGTFDTGLQSIGWNGEVYTLPTTFIANFSGTMAINYSVTSEGQTSNFTKDVNIIANLFTFGVLNLDDYPNDASVDTRLYWGFSESVPTVTADAPNSFSKTFQVQSVVIPEPSSALLFVAGLIGLALKRRRA